MSIRNIVRAAAQLGFATPTAAPIRIDNTSSRPFINPYGTGTTERELGVVGAEVVITTKSVLGSDNGKTFYLDLAAGFVVTLPAVALGLAYKFILRTAVTGSTTIVCPAAATLFKGHVLTSATGVADFDTTAVATLTFVLNKAVAGDSIAVWSDGVNWFFSAECTANDAITAA